MRKAPVVDLNLVYRPGGFADDGVDRYCEMQRAMNEAAFLLILESAVIRRGSELCKFPAPQAIRVLAQELAQAWPVHG